MLPLRDNVPTRCRPIVTWGLIVANILVFFAYQTPDLEGSVDELAYHPCEVDRSCEVVGQDWFVTVWSSMFMHGDLLHLGGNMLFLWIFGNNVEDVMGRVRYLLFYLLAGVAATALQTAFTLSVASAEGAAIPNLGASGAISGVIGAYFLILPHARVLTLFFLGIIILREIPAWIVLGIYIALQLFDANFQWQNPPEGGGVAVFAHLGGILFGVLTVYLFRKRKPLRPAY
ncbi:MAG TPA: rhomboid family intramembrane serine protease [Gaiellaceae bacterium]|nr:rhomboid family intramembrane serine protease [Gaiellaceae bacterium]